VDRFSALERIARQRGLVLGAVELDVLDELWEEAKRLERATP
jgi:uncharacterized protein YabN with tetrapyrrole methylase and pyrophosphatase domain